MHEFARDSLDIAKHWRLLTFEFFIGSFVWLIAAIIFTVFVLIVGQVVWQGLPELSWEFLTASPERSGRAGGILPIIVSTMLVLAVCLCTAVPLALATAIWLAEFVQRHQVMGRIMRAGLDVLAGVPSIVFGLFGNAFFCITLDMGFSILAGGLTLACMVLPILIRSIEMALRAVSDDDRRAGAALGMSKTRLIVSVLLPAAMPGVVAGLLLGIGRALAETAALLFTSGYVTRMPESLLDSGRSMSIHIFDLAMNIPGGSERGYATAALLVLLLIAINVSAVSIGDRIARGGR